MLEARVERLEADVREIRDDLKSVKGDLANLRERLAKIEGIVSGLPGHGSLLAVSAFIVTAVGVMLRFMPPTP